MIAFANPYLVCTQCGVHVPGYTAPGVLVPCGHSAEARSVCRAWSPVDGCMCGVPHVEGSLVQGEFYENDESPEAVRRLHTLLRDAQELEDLAEAEARGEVEGPKLYPRKS